MDTYIRRARDKSARRGAETWTLCLRDEVAGLCGSVVGTSVPKFPTWAGLASTSLRNAPSVDRVKDTAEKAFYVLAVVVFAPAQMAAQRGFSDG